MDEALGLEIYRQLLQAMNAALDPALLVDAEPTLVEAMTTWETGALDSVPTMFEDAAAANGDNLNNRDSTEGTRESQDSGWDT